MNILANLRRPPILAAIIILIVCVVLWFSIAPAFDRLLGRGNSALQAGTQAVVASQDLVPVRTEPKNNAAVVLLAANGQNVTIVESGSGDGGRWYKVRIEVSTTKNTVEGWLPERTPGGQTTLAGK